MINAFTENLSLIKNPKGDILKLIKKSDKSFDKFGELYLSSIFCNEVKPWKLHQKAILNLIVIKGSVKFVLCNNNNNSNLETFEFILNLKRNYKKLIIPPNIWFAFQGMEEENVILSLSNIEHDPNEIIRENLDFIEYDWSLS